MIELDRDGDVFVLRSDDGENRYSPAALDRYDEHLATIEAAEGPKALVTVGTGKFFSNGLDLGYVGEHPDDFVPYLYRVQALFVRCLSLGCVTVAAVNGHAYGAGAMLALSHDFRIMRADRGYWCLPEVDLGMIFTPGMNALVSAMLTPAVAREAMITGRHYGGDEAMAAGIVHQAVPEDQVFNTAMDVARPLAAKAGDNVATIRTDLCAPALAPLRGD